MFLQHYFRFTFAQPPIHKIKGDALDIISFDNMDFYIVMSMYSRETGRVAGMTLPFKRSNYYHHLNMQKREMRMTWELTYHQFL